MRGRVAVSAAKRGGNPTTFVVRWRVFRQFIAAAQSSYPHQSHNHRPELARLTHCRPPANPRVLVRLPGSTATSPQHRGVADRLQRITTREAAIGARFDVRPSQEGEHWSRPRWQLRIHHFHAPANLRVEQRQHLGLAGELHSQVVGERTLGPNGDVGTDHTNLEPRGGGLLKQGQRGQISTSSSARSSVSAAKAAILCKVAALAPDGSFSSMFSGVGAKAATPSTLAALRGC